MSDNDRGKRQTASEVAGRQPGKLHYWDWAEPRLLVCEAEFVATPTNSQKNPAAASTAANIRTSDKPVTLQTVCYLICYCHPLALYSGAGNDKNM